MVAGSAAVILLGRLLGLIDLYVVGVAGILLVSGGIGWVRLQHIDLKATRRVRPARVSVGSSVRVEVSVRNVARRRSPVLEACDSFDAGRLGASWLVAPLGAGEIGRTTYALPTDSRGVFAVGPLGVELRDPFGLALVSRQVLPSNTLTVLPLVEPIAAPPRGRGGGAQGGAGRPPFRGQSGDDFYALRPYSAGDDLRRVHWPSTARRGEVMIRQDDHPWQDRTTVLLDSRATSPDGLEAAVSATASVVSAARGDLVRLVHPASGRSGVGGSGVGGSGIRDSGYGTAASHLIAMLDGLAAVTGATPGPEAQASFGQALRQLRDTPGAGTLVVVTSSTISRVDLDRVAALRPQFDPLVVVVIEAGGVAGVAGFRGSAAAGGTSGGVRLVRVTPGQPFSKAWSDALSRASVGDPRTSAGRPRTGSGFPGRSR